MKSKEYKALISILKCLDEIAWAELSTAEKTIVRIASEVTGASFAHNEDEEDGELKITFPKE